MRLPFLCSKKGLGVFTNLALTNNLLVCCFSVLLALIKLEITKCVSTRYIMSKYGPNACRAMINVYAGQLKLSVWAVTDNVTYKMDKT